jgi:hypothetical protein
MACQRMTATTQIARAYATYTAYIGPLQQPQALLQPTPLKSRTQPGRPDWIEQEATKSPWPVISAEGIDILVGAGKGGHDARILIDRPTGTDKGGIDAHVLSSGRDMGGSFGTGDWGGGSGGGTAGLGGVGPSIGGGGLDARILSDDQLDGSTLSPG